MAERLPNSDETNWADVLGADDGTGGFLRVGHEDDGNVKNVARSVNQIGHGFSVGDVVCLSSTAVNVPFDFPGVSETDGGITFNQISDFFVSDGTVVTLTITGDLSAGNVGIWGIDDDSNFHAGDPATVGVYPQGPLNNGVTYFVYVYTGGSYDAGLTGAGYYTGPEVEVVYVLAQADSVANAEAVGVVSEVADTDNFTLVTSGYVATLSGLTPGSVYFLSEATPGLLTITEPSGVGEVSKPLLIADSATSGWWFNWRGEVIGPGGGGFSIGDKYLVATFDINGQTLDFQPDLTETDSDGSGAIAINGGDASLIDITESGWYQAGVFMQLNASGGAISTVHGQLQFTSDANTFLPYWSQDVGEAGGTDPFFVTVTTPPFEWDSSTQGAVFVPLPQTVAGSWDIVGSTLYVVKLSGGSGGGGGTQAGYNDLQQSLAIPARKFTSGDVIEIHLAVNTVASLWGYDHNEVEIVRLDVATVGDSFLTATNPGDDNLANGSATLSWTLADSADTDITIDGGDDTKINVNTTGWYSLFFRADVYPEDATDPLTFGYLEFRLNGPVVFENGVRFVT